MKVGGCEGPQGLRYESEMVGGEALSVFAPPAVQSALRERFSFCKKREQPSRDRHRSQLPAPTRLCGQTAEKITASIG
jgi:hypothetical protein